MSFAFVEAVDNLINLHEKKKSLQISVIASSRHHVSPSQQGIGSDKSALLPL